MTTTDPLDPTALQRAVQVALKAWHSLENAQQTRLDHLLLVRERLAALDSQVNPAALRRATNEVLLSALDELKLSDARGAQVLRAHYLDAMLTKEVARKLNANIDQVNRLQRAAIHRITEILLSREQSVRETRAQQLEAALPPPQYDQLFGTESACQRLQTVLLKPTTPWIAVVAGLGGIGKTALAHAVTRQIIPHFYFERIHWLHVMPRQTLSAPSLVFEQLMAALAESLWPYTTGPAPAESNLARIRVAIKSRPHLVIIDNLESEAETAYLLENLPALAAPSKFLLTARTRPTGTGTSAFVISLSELTLTQAEALLRDQARASGLADLGSLTHSQAKSIYRLVGGNPLALKLIASLTVVQPLTHILQDLEQVKPGEIEAMYRRIYLKAWQALSQEAQALLQAMPLITEAGALPDQLQEISGLPEAQLWPAITELWSRSLLEVRGTLHEKRYGIHRLTETFLRTEIVRWPENASR